MTHTFRSTIERFLLPLKFSGQSSAQNGSTTATGETALQPPILKNGDSEASAPKKAGPDEPEVRLPSIIESGASQTTLPREPRSNGSNPSLSAIRVPSPIQLATSQRAISTMSKASPILFCDHRGEHSEEILQTLKDLGHVVVGSRFLRESLESLTELEPDVIVIDSLARQGLVELRALDQARQSVARKQSNGPSNGASMPPKVAPIGFLIVTDDDLPRIVGDDPLAGGPWDVIRRNAPLEEWQLRLERLRAGCQQATHMSELAHRASHDALTGLLRKDSFQERLSEHFSAAQRHHFEMALVLLDLDNFGSVNKLHNHVVGDRIIQSVGEAIRHALRTEDVAGRLGGDEFGIVLPYTGKVDSTAVVNRLRDAISSLSGRIPGAKSDIRVATSLGFETFNGSDIDTLATLRLHAERALRVSKERGGNQGVYFRAQD